MSTPAAAPATYHEPGHDVPQRSPEAWPDDPGADTWPSLLDEPQPATHWIDRDEYRHTAELRREHESWT